MDRRKTTGNKARKREREREKKKKKLRTRDSKMIRTSMWILILDAVGSWMADPHLSFEITHFICSSSNLCRSTSGPNVHPHLEARSPAHVMQDPDHFTSVVITEIFANEIGLGRLHEAIVT